ncbi:predicted protein [Streptomyces sviceus ATCC 29083]|uniref:Uncharacterized protein n=1 Tax=Streptomyces sviceus (strain ATCC 29083 / DSM 924 / JCM 4929 / NBRC 13980 / NCIMB 11184 / NRRL 5439 / UC 5370) TaxID=463191 RepID=D6XBS2_STRX2|nr:predicted protein [Streptomyces sviceus ATCC 29083]
METASATWWIRSSSQGAPSPTACGKSLASLSQETPCSASVPVRNEAMPRRSTAGAYGCGSAIRSSSVIRPSRSSARLSIGGTGPRNGSRAAGRDEEPTRKTPKQAGCELSKRFDACITATGCQRAGPREFS